MFTHCCFAECNLEKDPKSKQNCDKCVIDDDEYCVYNECYFDKQYRKMKIDLSLSEKQEIYIDNLYKIYKLETEALCAKYAEEKNKILSYIACDNPCWKGKTKNLKRLKNDIKVRYICFEEDITDLLDKCQYKKFKKFKKEQREKIELILKYGAVYKFPCENCKE